MERSRVFLIGILKGSQIVLCHRKKAGNLDQKGHRGMFLLTKCDLL